MKTNLLKKAFMIALTTTTLSALTGCNKTIKTEFSVTPTTTTIAYTKDGDPVDPLELVAIDRVEESDEVIKTASPTPSASASSEAKTKDSDKKEKSDNSAKKNTDNTSKDERTIELAEKAYVADGIEVEKVSPEAIDTSVVGDVTVLFTLKDTENNNSTSEVSVTFNVVDKTSPAFKLTKTEDTITVGAEFDAKSYVKDAAGCEYVEEAPKDSSKYENGWYTITSNVKTDKAGSYTVKFHAVGTNGVSTDKTVDITVEEKETSTTKDEKSSSKDSSSTSSKTAEKKDSSSSSKKSTTSSTNKSSSKNNTSSNSNSNSGNTNFNANTSTNSNTSNQATDNSPTNSIPQQTCTTVHHDATGHNETVWVQDTAAWDETVVTDTDVVCNGCGEHFATMNDWNSHSGVYARNDDWSHATYHTTPSKTETVHHEATGHNETVWVQDTAALDEQVCN